MPQENILELIIDDDDDENIIDKDGWFDAFYFANNKKTLPL